MSKFGFDKALKQFGDLKRTLPPKIGNLGTRFFIKAFADQGWTDKGLVKWQKPQRMIPGTPAYKYPKKRDLERHSRAILVGKSGGTKSGAHAHLRQSVNTSLKRTEWTDILFSVPQVYAKQHNEGLDGMPQRKFIGNSAALTNQITEKIKEEMKGVFGKK